MIDVNKIVELEQGTLSMTETLDLFSELIKSGLVWKLQGSYGRTANDLIRSGFITPDGEITDLGQLEAADADHWSALQDQYTDDDKLLYKSVSTGQMYWSNCGEKQLPDWYEDAAEEATWD